MELASGLWNGLTSELVERALSFLPVLDLCKYHLVSKRWNLLISNLEFGALWLENAQQDTAFITARYVHCHRTGVSSPEPSNIEGGVSIFDLKTRRWHKVHKHDTHPFRDGLMYTGSWAIHGGLVCQYKTVPTLMDKSLVVYNPIVDTTKDLPTAPVHLLPMCNYPIPIMAVNIVEHNYKVFLFCRGSTSMSTRDWPLMLVYNSVTNAWVCSTDVFLLEIYTFDGDFRYTRKYLCSVMFLGAFHVLVRINSEHRLSYDISQNVWEDVGVRIDGWSLCSSKLVVAGG